MNLLERLALCGYGPDGEPLRGAERMLDLTDGGEYAHLLAEHRAACDEIRRLRALLREAAIFGGIKSQNPELWERMRDALRGDV